MPYPGEEQEALYAVLYSVPHSPVPVFKLQWSLLVLRFSYILLTTVSTQCLYSSNGLINTPMSHTRHCRFNTTNPTTAIPSQFNPPEITIIFILKIHFIKIRGFPNDVS